MRIRRIDIENFRGIRSASWPIPTNRHFFALIGPGDSTKTTVLSAVDWALHDRYGLSVLDTDFYACDIEAPIRIRVAIDQLPDELIALDAFGTFLAGIDETGEWSHDPSDALERCVIIEFRVENDLDPVWQSFRPPLPGGEESEPVPIRAKHRARISAYRIDDRVDAHLRWTRTSSLGKLTANRDGSRATLTRASRAAREAANEAMSDDLKILAGDVQEQIRKIGTSNLSHLRPGLDISLANSQGNLALFDGDIPLINFGLGTRRLAGAATQQLANEGATTLLVDEVEYGLEPHRLFHLLRHLRNANAFSQVFATTHSPMALRYLEPDELIRVHSDASGITTFEALSDPASLRPLLKTTPEAFLSRRIVINEGKTEFGVVLQHLDAWEREPDAEPIPSAALGALAVDGGGGTQAAQNARQLLLIGYSVILFMDSDDPKANALIPPVREAGGAVVQWGGSHSIESAICDQLDEAGLTALIRAGIEAADEEESAAEDAFTDALIKYGAPETAKNVLNVATWEAAGTALPAAREAVGKAANKKSWFKRIDKGRRLGQLILETQLLQTGHVKSVMDQLRTAIYASLDPASDEENAEAAAILPPQRPHLKNSTGRSFR